MSAEPWWTWRWDRDEVADVSLEFTRITRWRRGSLLTIYRHENQEGTVAWWFYLPFNYAIGFAKS